MAIGTRRFGKQWAGKGNAGSSSGLKGTGQEQQVVTGSSIGNTEGLTLGKLPR